MIQNNGMNYTAGKKAASPKSLAINNAPKMLLMADKNQQFIDTKEDETKITRTGKDLIADFELNGRHFDKSGGQNIVLNGSDSQTALGSRQTGDESDK